MTEREIAAQMNKVREWLVNEGIYKDKTSNNTSTYHFIAEFPQGSGHTLHIIQPKNREDLMFITSGLALSPEHSDPLSSMPKPRLDEFLWELRFDLLSMKPGFDIIPHDRAPQQIQFERALFFDGLNENMFMEALNDIWKSKLYVIWKMAQMFGSSPPKQGVPMYS